MPSVRLTLLIEDHADLDMEVRVVAVDAVATPLAVPVGCSMPALRSVEDDYVLGGYAGI